MSITTGEKVEVNAGAEDAPGAREHDETTVIVGGVVEHLTQLLKDLAQQQQSLSVTVETVTHCHSGNHQHVSTHLSQKIYNT